MIFTIAIDGPAAAGKGTIAKSLACEFSMAHLDTGLLYRAVGLRMLEGDAPIHAAQNLTPEDLTPEEHLRTHEVAQAASKVATLPEVRANLLAFQRHFARREGGAVLDGRDIGTVICPEAEAKLFVTASAETRAERRFLELTRKGLEITRAQVLADVQARDARDRSRDTAPMVAAADAILLDTTELSIEQALDRAREHILLKLKNSKTP